MAETKVVYVVALDVRQVLWAHCTLNDDGVGFKRVEWTLPGQSERVDAEITKDIPPDWVHVTSARLAFPFPLTVEAKP